MTLPMFFSEPGALSAAISIPAEPFELAGEEGRHAVTVKRIQVGERVLIAEGDGSGLVAECEVIETRGKDGLVVRLDTWHEDVSRTTLIVVLALIKGERMERAVEQLTEIGVGTIVPWSSERSVVSLKGETGAKIHKRLERKAFEAAKQCRQPTLPTVLEPMSTETLKYFLTEMKEVSDPCEIVVLHEEAAVGLDGLSRSGQEGEAREGLAESTILIVGPEGGLTEQEVAGFEELGARTWVLGRTVMRAGTAAVVAAGWLIGASGHWDLSRDAKS